MELKMLEEYEDGSCRVEIEATNAEKMLLFQEGLIKLLQRALEEEERKAKIPVLERKKDTLEDFQP